KQSLLCHHLPVASQLPSWPVRSRCSATKSNPSMAPAAPPMTSRNSGASRSSGGSGRRAGMNRLPKGLKAMTALVVLRDKAIKPLLAATQELRPSRGALNPRPLDTHYDTIRLAMQGVFQELGPAARTSTIISSGFALKGLTLSAGAMISVASQNHTNRYRRPSPVAPLRHNEDGSE